MSGLLCVFDPDGIPQQPQPYLGALRRMAHRGPDGEGFILRPRVFLGHRLMAPASGQPGSQPACTADGRVALVLDGRLSDRQMLVHRPGIAHPSDAMLLLDTYLDQGPSCFSRLEGCWALVLWDERTGQLIASRDRLGVRPLYCYQGPRLILASEIKSILALDDAARLPDEQRILRYLPRGSIDDWTGSFFRNVRPVAPGSVLTVDRDRVASTRFWSLAPATDDSLKADAVLDVLAETVARDAAVTAPSGLALSGGIDSAMLAGLIGRKPGAGRHHVRAFSFRPPETPDESAQVAATVKYSGLAHVPVSVDHIDCAEALDRLLEAHDEPVQTAGNLYQYLLREAMAAAGCKAVLVGHGSDEIFAGYDFLAVPFLAALIRHGRLGDCLRFARGARGLLAAHPLRILALGATEALYPARPGNGLDSVSDLLAEPPSADAAIPPPPMFDLDRAVPGYRFLTAMLNCFREHVPLFVRVEDRNAAAHGMELVAPFMDHRVVEAALAFPFHEYMRDGLNKAILRRAARGIVAPEVLAQQQKFYTPGNSAHLAFGLLRNRMLDMLGSAAFLEHGLWSRRCRDLYLEDAARPRRGDVWLRIYMVQRWREKFASR